MKSLFLNRLAMPILGMPRVAKRVVVLAVDTALCVLTVWLAYYLRLDEWVRLSGDPLGTRLGRAASVLMAFPCSSSTVFTASSSATRALPAMHMVLRAIAVYGLIYMPRWSRPWALPGCPAPWASSSPCCLCWPWVASRALARYWLGGSTRTIVQQADEPAQGADLRCRQHRAAVGRGHGQQPEMQVVGFLDDDDRLHGHVLNGLPIHNPADLDRPGARLRRAAPCCWPCPA
jgi:FlaA1/EpsC-like NDP-sugar epimerase